jgi:putative peptidoglycan lipid II flippase
MVATKVSLVLAGSLLLHGRAVLIALTVSTSTSYLVGCLVGHQLLRRQFGGLRFTPVLTTTGWIAAASAAGGVAGLAVVLAGNAVLGDGRLAALIELVIGGAVGSAVLVLLALRLPLPEVAQIAAAVRGRTGRGDRDDSDETDRSEAGVDAG